MLVVMIALTDIYCGEDSVFIALCDDETGHVIIVCEIKAVSVPCCKFKAISCSVKLYFTILSVLYFKIIYMLTYHLAQMDALNMNAVKKEEQNEEGTRLYDYDEITIKVRFLCKCLNFKWLKT